MEVASQITSRHSTSFQPLFARFAYLILCFRGYFSGIMDDTLVITLFLNFIIVCAIDFKHIYKDFFIFATLSLLTVYNRDILALIDILAIIYVLRNASISFFIRTNAIILFIYFCIWGMLVATGMLHDKIMVMPKGIAHCYGYENSNQLGMLGFQIISAIFLLSKKKWKILVFISIPLTNELFFSWSIARTPWIGGYVMMLIMFLSAVKLLPSFMKYFVAILPLIIFGCLIYFAKHLSMYPELDIIFTTRFSNYARLLTAMSPINWIIGFPMGQNIIIDSSYFMILCSGGIGCVILFWGAYFKAILTRWNFLYPYLPFIIAMLANGVGENSFSSANGLSLIFWFLIFCHEKPKHRHKLNNSK